MCSAQWSGHVRVVLLRGKTLLREFSEQWKARREGDQSGWKPVRGAHSGLGLRSFGKALALHKDPVPFLEPILKTANQTLDVLARACNLSTGKEAETGGWIPGVHWPATLASLVRGTDSKKRKKKKSGQDPRNDRTT